MAERIPIPAHLGGGWVDDPGPAPLDRRARALRRAWRHPACREYIQQRHVHQHGNFAALSAEPWQPEEIEEVARFARLKRDE